MKSLAIIVVCSFFIFTSCKEPTISGVETPTEDDFNFARVDTFTVEATTIKESDINIIGSNVTIKGMLGHINDNIFGNISSSIYIQFVPSKSFLDTTSVVDSAVLFLNYYNDRYNRFYGSTKITPFNIIINEIEAKIVKSDTFTLKSIFNVKPFQLCNINILPNIKDDTIIHGNIKYSSPLLIAKLDNSIGEKILNKSDISEAAFIDIFNGLKVSAIPVNSSDTGGIMNFSLRDSRNKIRVYYHNDNKDSLYFDYLVGQNCAALNSFNFNNYDNANPYFLNQINNSQVNSRNDSLLFIQGVGKSKIKIKIPYFRNFTKKGLVIHKAKLIIPLNELNNNCDIRKIVPGFLVLFGISDKNENFKLLDHSDIPLNNYFGGYFDYKKNEYFFNITRYLQSIINNPSQSFNGFYLFDLNRDSEPNKVIINGGNKKIGSRMRLEVSYTII